jgi:hypothetical protein
MRNETCEIDAKPPSKLEQRDNNTRLRAAGKKIWGRASYIKEWKYSAFKEEIRGFKKWFGL